MRNLNEDIEKLVRDIKKQEFMKKKTDQEEEDNPFQKEIKEEYLV